MVLNLSTALPDFFLHEAPGVHGNDPFAGFYRLQGDSCESYCAWIDGNETVDVYPDPRFSTELTGGSGYWACRPLGSQVWSLRGFFGPVFTPLRCTEAHEILSNAATRFESSVSWWSCVMVIAMVLFCAVTTIGFKWRRIHAPSTNKRMNKTYPKSLIHDSHRLETAQTRGDPTVREADGSGPRNAWIIIGLFCWYEKSNAYICGFLFILLSFLAFSFALSAASRAEANGYVIPRVLMWLTPACSANACSGAHSFHRAPRSTEVGDSKNIFNLVVASDVQFWWFDGEWSLMSADGPDYPDSVCSYHDSYEECAVKVSEHTNKEQIAAYGHLGPISLILNGDLTGLFEPEEIKMFIKSYENLPTNIKHFYPSLGNHDLEATGSYFGFDEWYGGVGSCNGRHAKEYIRSGVGCGTIARFGKKLTGFDLASLAYSWDKGRIHFVQTNFYPEFSSASLSIQSSLDWLHKDLSAAYSSGLNTVLLIHSIDHVTPALDAVVTGKPRISVHFDQRVPTSACLTHLSISQPQRPISSYSMDKL